MDQSRSLISIPLVNDQERPQPHDPRHVQEIPLLTPEAQRAGMMRDMAIRHFIDNSPDPNDTEARLDAATAISQYTGETASQVFRNLDSHIKSIYGQERVRPQTLVEDLHRSLREAFIGSEMSELNRRRRDYNSSGRDLSDREYLRLEELRQMQQQNITGEGGGFIRMSLRDLMGFVPSLTQGARDSMIGTMGGMAVGMVIAKALVATAPISVPALVIAGKAAGVTAASAKAGGIAGSFASYQRRASGGIYGMQDDIYRQAMEQWESTPEHLRGDKPVWNEREAFWSSEIFGSFAAAASSARLHRVPGVSQILGQVGTQSAVNLAASTTMRKGAGVVMGRFLGRYAQASAEQGFTEFFQSGFETAGGLWTHEAVKIGTAIGLPENYLRKVFDQAVAGATSAARASLVNPLSVFGIGGQMLQEGRIARGSVEWNRAVERTADSKGHTELIRSLDQSIAETNSADVRSRLEVVRNEIQESGPIAAQDVAVKVNNDGTITSETRGKPAVSLTFQDAGGDNVTDMVITSFKVHNKKDAAIALRESVRAIQSQNKQTRVSTDLNEKQQAEFDETLFSLSEPHRLAHRTIEARKELVNQYKKEAETAKYNYEAIEAIETAEGAGSITAARSQLDDAQSNLASAEHALAEAEARFKVMPPPDLRLLHEVNEEALRNDIKAEVEARGVWNLDPNDKRHE